jgi:hypothetical protein
MKVEIKDGEREALRAQFWGLVTKEAVIRQENGEKSFSPRILAGFSALQIRLIDGKTYSFAAAQQPFPKQTVINAAAEARLILLTIARKNGPLRRLLQFN